MPALRRPRTTRKQQLEMTLRPTPYAKLACLALLPLAACASNVVDARMQSIVETLASEHQDVTRLTVHTKPDAATRMMAIASTSPAKRGKVSDPEDQRAVDSGEIVVLEEKGGIDVTVPMRHKSGVFYAAAGVTFKSSIGRDAAIKRGRAIAATLERALAH